MEPIQDRTRPADSSPELDADGLRVCRCDTCTGAYKLPGYVERRRTRSSSPFTPEQVAAWQQKRELHR